MTHFSSGVPYDDSTSGIDSSGGGGGGPPAIMLNALVYFNETSIIGDPLITGLTNLGTGGTDYDMSVVDTAADLQRGSVNGLPTAFNFAQGGLATSDTGLTPDRNIKLFLVWRNKNAAQNNSYIISGNTSTARASYIVNTNNTAFQLNSTTNFDAPLADNSIKTRLTVITLGEGAVETVGGLSVLGDGSTSGNAIGLTIFNFRYFFSTWFSTNWFEGHICEYALFDSPAPGSDPLTPTEITQIENYLIAKWAIPT